MSFEERYALITDPQALSAALGIKNVAKYFRDEIKNNEDAQDAESKMQALESAWATVKAQIDTEEYVIKRQFEYAKIDHLLLEALIEKELGNPQKFADYIALRNDVKTRIPKP